MNCVHYSKQLCTGCGVCAGLCDAIEMSENDIGHYFPRVDLDKCKNCGKCMKICPVVTSYKDKALLNDNLWGGALESKANQTGYYLNCYEGYVPSRRKHSASGGLCSQLLMELIDRNLVQSVYCAHSNPDNGKLFISERVSTCEEIAACAGSAYYPIEISETIKSIKSRDELTAVVCLPCQATALRLAMKQDRRLKERIKYIIGLICGGMPGKSLVEYIATDSGCDFSAIDKATFREKDAGINCNNCQVKMYAKGELKCTSRFHNGESFGFAYLNHLFHNVACDACDDIFAESADIAFGDAWFPENQSNELGTSICITRNKELDHIIQNMGENVVMSSVERIIAAQKNVGLINRKKVMSGYYAYIFKKKGVTVNSVNPVRPGIKTRLRVVMELKVKKESAKAWKKYKAGKISFDSMKKKLTEIVGLKKKVLR